MTYRLGFFSIALLFGLLTLPACISTSPQPIRGLLFTDVLGPNQALVNDKKSHKHGEACTHTVLILFAWGDASIEAAKRAGGIKEIATVDYRDLEVLSILYDSTCTIVYGT